MVENDIPHFFNILLFQIIFIFLTVRFEWIYKTGPPTATPQKCTSFKKKQKNSCNKFFKKEKTRGIKITGNRVIVSRSRESLLRERVEMGIYPYTVANKILLFDDTRGCAATVVAHRKQYAIIKKRSCYIFLITSTHRERERDD